MSKFSDEIRDNVNKSINAVATDEFATSELTRQVMLDQLGVNVSPALGSAAAGILLKLVTVRRIELGLDPEPTAEDITKMENQSLTDFLLEQIESQLDKLSV